tara:strand:+ start:739 stop:882 length:144 start_codon:yes stop_codon:yes gene_type:complete
MNTNNWDNEPWVKRTKELFRIEIPIGFRIYQFAIVFTFSGIVFGSMV